jgi:hypothetical protein
MVKFLLKKGGLLEMARYAKHIHEMHSNPKELKILPTKARKVPFIMDGALSPGVSHHIEVMFITESGTDYIPQQPFELPPKEQLPDLVKDLFFTGSKLIVVKSPTNRSISLRRGILFSNISRCITSLKKCFFSSGLIWKIKLICEEKLSYGWDW